MRFIDIEDLKLPDGWKEKAQNLTEQLKACQTAAERKKLISKNEKLWKDLKDNLAKLSSDKCWYSEAKDIMSDKDVDHFRPKKKSVDIDGSEYEGYWWLAFCWENFRFSSEYCNRLHRGRDGKSRGKKDYFPLKKGSFRATGPEHDCRLEENYLLDPIVLGDTLLLSFDETGEAIPNPLHAPDTWDYQRAHESIDRYHLNYRLIRQKREELWKMVQRMVNEIEDMLASPQKNSPIVRSEIESKMKQLRKLASNKSELSATVIASLKSCDVKWARDLAVA